MSDCGKLGRVQSAIERDSLLRMVDGPKESKERRIAVDLTAL